VGHASTRIRSLVKDDIDTGTGYMIACFGRGLYRRHAFVLLRTIRRRFKIVYSIFYRTLCILSNLELIYMVYLKEQDILYLRSHQEMLAVSLLLLLVCGCAGGRLVLICRFVNVNLSFK